MASMAGDYLGEQLDKEREYWLQKLSGDLPLTGLPIDFKRQAAFSDGKVSREIKFDPEHQDKLLKVCGGDQVLAFAVLTAALKVCLYKYTGANDLIIGAAIHERYSEVGAFNKVIVLRDRIDGEKTVKELLLDVKRTLSEAYTHQKYPFDRLVNLLNLQEGTARRALFNVVAVMDDINNRENLKRLQNDLTLVFSLKEGTLTGAVEYDPALFAEQTIEIFGKHFRTALRAMLDHPEEQIGRLELLTESRKREVIVDYNRTEAEYPQDSTVVRLFEEQAGRTPDAPAVVAEEGSLTYRELNGRANQLAGRLQKLGVGVGSIVGIYLEHSRESLIALLGILKAGAAYAPLDPEHPRARLAYMIGDAQLSVLLTQHRLKHKLPESDARIICLDADWDAVSEESEENLPASARPEDPAYVIYTSGSTGDPKGVTVQHRALVNYVWWAKTVYLRGETLVSPLYSSLAFDLTITMIYPALITGNQIIVYPQKGKETPLLDALRDDRAKILKLTPSHCSLVKGLDLKGSRVRRLIVGGEAFETDLALSMKATFGEDLEIFNEYGPTEATVGCMIHRFDPSEDNRAFVPIGKPAANTQIYVLDELLRPVPENVLGELYIGGDGLALGYHGKDDLTAQRFISNPFIADARIYKTGDVARRLPGGVLEFAGRNDDQVKFHGHRVELNEARSVLNRHPAVRDSVVAVTKDNNGYDVMVAYYASKQELETGELRAFMAEEIVEETLPNFFVHLKRLPLNLNGKVDVRALPTLDEIKQRAKRNFIAPRTPIETTLAEIWAELLGVEQVGVYDNFFELGGHSLMATQVISRMRKAFELEIPMRALLDMPTIADLALTITQMYVEQNDIDEIARMIEEIRCPNGATMGHGIEGELR